MAGFVFGMETVSPLVGAVRPFLENSSVTTIQNGQAVLQASKHQAEQVLEESSWLWQDQRLLWLLGGAAVGLYFGFRIGVVSGR